MSRNSEKRLQIICAAQDVFSELGFDRARISDIARKAKVADGTIYLYFKSKDDLLISLFEERVQPAMEAIEAKVDEGPQDPRGRFASLIFAYLDAMKADPSLGSIITMQVRQSGRFIREYDNRPLARFFKVLKTMHHDGINQGIFRSDISSDTLRWMVFGSLDAFTLAWSLGRGKTSDLAPLGQGLVDVLLRGLSTGEQPTLMPQPAAAEAVHHAAPQKQVFDPALD